jgi:hypothetical protein
MEIVFHPVSQMATLSGLTTCSACCAVVEAGQTEGHRAWHMVVNGR